MNIVSLVFLAQLKEKSLLAIRSWNERFGEGYPKLKLGFNYLKYNKKVGPLEFTWTISSLPFL